MFFGSIIALWFIGVCCQHFPFPPQDGEMTVRNPTGEQFDLNKYNAIIGRPPDEIKNNADAISYEWYLNDHMVFQIETVGSDILMKTVYDLYGYTPYNFTLDDRYITTAWNNNSDSYPVYAGSDTRVVYVRDESRVEGLQQLYGGRVEIRLSD